MSERERREERKTGPRQSEVNIPAEKNEHPTVKETLRMGRTLLSYEIPFSSKKRISGQRSRDLDCCHLGFPGAYASMAHGVTPSSQSDYSFSKVCPPRPSQGACLYQRQCLHPHPGLRPGREAPADSSGGSCAISPSCRLHL